MAAAGAAAVLPAPAAAPSMQQQQQPQPLLCDQRNSSGTNLAQLIYGLLFCRISAMLKELLHVQEGAKELMANLPGICSRALQVVCGDVQQRRQVTLKSWLVSF